MSDDTRIITRETGHKTLPLVYGPNAHSVRAHMVDDDARKVIGRLVRSGFKAHIVGGGVRDLLLQKRPKDFDIATDAHPKEVRRLFRNSRIIGRRFQLVHVFFGPGRNIEVSTFRAQTVVPADDEAALLEVDVPELLESELEIESDAQNESTTAAAPESFDDNTFGTEETDALRRDITINALFYDAMTDTILDYVGGMDDLKQGIVRVIGDPATRFKEDPVRLLRVVRHAARSGFAIEQGTFAALQSCGALLREASQVRIFEEVRKDILSGSVYQFLVRLAETDLLQYFVPDVAPELLTSSSALSETLSRFDMQVHAESPPASSVFLAVLLRFSYKASAADESLNEEMPFETYDALLRHCERAFPALTVPRRERERACTIVQVWFALYHGESPQVSYRTLHGAAADIREFLKILPSSSRDRDIFNGLRKALDGAPDPITSSFDGARGGEGRSRRRGGRRRRGGERGSSNGDGGEGVSSSDDEGSSTAETQDDAALG